MRRTPQTLALAGAWIVALAILGWFIERELVIGTDLRLFLPQPETPEQRLLLDEIGEGPASRLLAIALAGAPPEELAEVSRALAEELRGNRHFKLVANGEVSLDAVPEELLAYRYLLSSSVTVNAFDQGSLRSALQARARDLASPAGAFLEPWLARDPTLEMLAVLERWQPMREPRRELDVWFDRAGERALLMAQTEAAAFDPEGQRAAIESIRTAVAALTPSSQIELTVSGAGAFSVLMETRTRNEAERLGTAATIGMIVLLLIAYRRAGSVVLSILPLASAGLAGLAAVSAVFGTVHGITLAFGFTLIGVAQDYPLHLLSHRRPGHAPRDIAHELWPTLATGVASTCIAYFTFLFSGVIGLAQLACFTVVGLAVAGLATRYALPALMDESTRDFGDSALLERIWARFAALPRMRWPALAIALASSGFIALAPQPLWENDLGKLTPVPRDLIERDQALRAELGAPDVRHMLVVEAPDDEAALRRLEVLDRELAAAVERGVLAGYDHAARYLPSVATQMQRREHLPEPTALRTALDEAVSATPFRRGVFEPFIENIARAKTLPPLTVERLHNSPLAASLDMLLNRDEHGATALVTLAGVKDLTAISQLIERAGEGVMLLDLKQASESLVAQQRTHILQSLAIAALALIAVISFALRSRARVVRVLAPMALTTAMIVAVLQAAGVSLTLFHLISLILAAGLGLDYALFFERAATDRAEQRRTLHAILVCSLATFLVFALLATSSLPVLEAIGSTVALGVAFNFVLAALLTRPATAVTAQATLPHARELVPHQGAMCLLERVLEWDQDSIVLETNTHRSPRNPLRSGERLRAVHLCEYGAQAMAAHGTLTSRAAGAKVKAGMLVSLRAVKFHCDYVEDLPGSLRVEARCLQAGAHSQQYAFTITHAGTLLCEGRAAVITDAAAGPSSPSSRSP